VVGDGRVGPMAKALKKKFEQLIDKECRISEGQ
jgi:hypothetical protein